MSVDLTNFIQYGSLSYIHCQRQVNNQHVIPSKQLDTHSKCLGMPPVTGARQLVKCLLLFTFCTQVLLCPQAYNMRSLFCILLLFSAVASSFASFVFDLDSNTFDHYLRDKDVMLVDFFAPW